MAKERPIGVTILAFLAILGAVNAFIYTLQMLHLLPTFLGPIAFYQFSLIGAFFWGLLFFIWLAVFRMLWEVQPQGWMFMVLIAGFDLIFAIINALGGSSWEAMAPIIIICGLILIYSCYPAPSRHSGFPSRWLNKSQKKSIFSFFLRFLLDSSILWITSMTPYYLHTTKTHFLNRFHRKYCLLIMPSLILIGVIIFTIALFVYSLISHRIEGSMVTAPMIFVAIGLLVSPDGLDIIPLSANSELVLVFAEIALVLILFSDAARIDFHKLKGNRSFPSRLLGIGLPLTIFLGAVIAILCFTDLSFPEAALIGVILAPTDAGLGQVIVNSPKVPARIRQALNVESGLNDGGAIPFFAFFLVLAQAEELAIPASQWVIFAVEQIGFGILVGLVVGLAGGYLVNKAIEKGLMRGRFQYIGFLALAVIAYAAATAVGGSGFIAAFVGGLATSLTGRAVGESIIEFTSTSGEIFSLGVFFIFGVIAASLLSGITQTVILYAVLSLTLIRILPVALSLKNTGLKTDSVLFIGWFGPRGLASIVLLLITLNEAPDIPGLQTIAVVVSATVLFSVFAHGISANPAITWYAGKMASLPADAPELKEVLESPTRTNVMIKD